MKILSLSLDPLTLDKESVVAIRSVRYGKALDKYTIIVPSISSSTVVLSLNVAVHGTGGKTKIAQYFNMFKLAFSMMKKEQYDVITSQDTYYLGLVGLLLSRLYRSGFEVQVHGIEKLSFFRKLITKLTLTQAHSIRVVGKRLWRRLVDEFGAKEENMTLVPIHVEVSSLGFNTQASDEERSELRDHQDEFHQKYGDRFNIVSVNRLVPIKNIPMQIEAIARLKEEFPQVLLHIIGEGIFKEALQKQIVECQLSSHVVLHGARFKSELGSFLTEGDCFVLTSDSEGYGMAVIEAAAAGIPIVMTDVGCADEIVKNGESALIVPIKNNDAFTAALRQILTNENLRIRLKENAARSIARLPTFEDTLQKYIESWHKAVMRSKLSDRQGLG